ncbi:sulfoxide reductase heme-binding subunit YedZ [Mannheimia varigena]|uniref:protein-methionine-sulfoxide reductase heme-binding subunit MsrQ n=1 Tax=Mannheimia varigena TaxID=85404 RepID=UPI00159E897A|nr:protein-methionine-sulfoxide reductase heme-binding subunit MsrQ [Mannheimia varigena]QLB17186.1 sulfoxide reductase heme-binding subunit YedZ [Mannheimia varigena]
MLTGLRILIHLGCLLPLVWVAQLLYTGNETVLGADPIKELEHFLGYGAIVIFCIMFLLGIALQYLKKNQYQILRRPLGLWAFAWAALHISSYLLLELSLDVKLFFSELAGRPYLILGAAAFFILSIMAITSLPMLKRKLGKRWGTIHQWAYPALVLAMVHYYWSVKSVTFDPIIIGVLVLFIVAHKIQAKFAKK